LSTYSKEYVKQTRQQAPHHWLSLEQPEPGGQHVDPVCCRPPHWLHAVAVQVAL
jgi:hypothetical protein